MKRRNRYNKSVYRSLTVIMQFGINMLVPICMMSALGIYLDKKLDTSYWMVVLFFVGAVAGAQNVYRLAKQIMREPGREHTGSRSKPEQHVEMATGGVDRERKQTKLHEIHRDIKREE